MKVLVATRRTQGEQPGDFCFTREDEILMQGYVCSVPDCGCIRSLTGIETRKSTTSFIVVDKPTMTLEALANLFYLSEAAAGFEPPDPKKYLKAARKIRRFAKGLSEGMVFGIRDSGECYVRSSDEQGTEESHKSS